MVYRDWVTLADTQVPIGDVLQDLFGIQIPHGSGEWKTNCPLDHEHRDGGYTSAMKVFTESNSAYCFNHRMQFTPTFLWKIYNGWDKVSRITVARTLLEHFGLLKRFEDPDERWDRLERDSEEEVDTTSLKEALRIYASSLPNYSTLQYENSVLDLMGKLYLQANELPDNAEYATLEMWLTKSKIELDALWRDNEFY